MKIKAKIATTIMLATALTAGAQTIPTYPEDKEPHRY